MKFHTYISAFILLQFLASCSSDDVDNTISQSDTPMKFDVYTGSPVQTQTRGTSISSEDVQTQGIGIFAFYQKAKSNGYPVNFNKYTGEPTFMYNQQVTATTTGGVTTWDYTPHKYWSNNEGDQFSFFAYAPYDPTFAWEDLKVFSNLKGDRLERHYIIEDNVEDQQDFLWANPILNMSKPDDVNTALQFNFYHLCAKVGFALAVNDGSSSEGTATAWTDATTTITVDNIVVSDVYTDFTYNYKWNGTDWDVTMTDIEGTQDITLLSSHSHLQNNLISTTTYTSAAYQQLNADDCWLMLAPQTGLNVSITYTVTTTDGSFDSVHTNTYSTSLTDILESGKAYLIKYLLSPTKLSVTADIVDWTSSGDINSTLP